MKSLEFSPEAQEVLYQLAERYPDTPFLALGQTILWDEPTKACFVRFLHEYLPGAIFWHGIHDTDYFSRLPRPLAAPRPYQVVEHNDTTTGGLWVAMCEAARLFGAEAVPSRACLRHYGCNLKKALAASDGPPSLDALTAAWGWKGIVSTGDRELVARDVLLVDLTDELLSLISEALQNTVETILDDAARRSAQSVANTLISEISKYARQHPTATLTQLYQHILPHLYEVLLGEVPANLNLTSSAQLFRFSPTTAGRPLFQPLAIFLDPRTRAAARRSYSDAVAGSGIYTLEQLGEEAIPFDLVIPRRGRGTISILPREILIHTPEPISLRAAQPIESPQALAETIAGSLGEDVALVGKAVMLIPMIAQEFILVFHEGASAYTEHTHEFIVSMERAGVSLECKPILRLRYRTWESLGATQADLALPEHLAWAFGTHEITAQEFAARWQQVCAQQIDLLRELKAARQPAALLGLLARYNSGSNVSAAAWQERLASYNLAGEALRVTGGAIAALQRRTDALRHEAYQLRRQIQDLEKEKGRHFHDVLQPALARLSGASADTELAYRHELTARITEARAALAHVVEQIADVRLKQDALQADAKSCEARRIIAEQEGHAEVERLRLTRNAILTTRSLELTNHRPTGWWFPLVSPDGAWFRRLAETCVLETESLCHTPAAQGASS